MPLAVVVTPTPLLIIHAVLQARSLTGCCCRLVWRPPCCPRCLLSATTAQQPPPAVATATAAAVVVVVSPGVLESRTSPTGSAGAAAAETGEPWIAIFHRCAVTSPYLVVCE